GFDGNGSFDDALATANNNIADTSAANRTPDFDFFVADAEEVDANTDFTGLTPEIGLLCLNDFAKGAGARFGNDVVADFQILSKSQLDGFARSCAARTNV